MGFLTQRDRIAILLIVSAIVAGWGIRYFRADEGTSAITVIQDAIPLPEALIDSENDSESSLFAPININTASRDELMQLTMIGPVKADAIVAYREEHGYFMTIDEIVNVHGIGPATLDRIRKDINVNDVQPAKTMTGNEK